MAKTTAQVKADLLARRDTILTELAAMSNTTVGGKPNARGEGLNIDHVGYRKSLLEELEMIDKRLNANSPAIVISQGR